MSPDDPRHGTLTGYKYLGCRCPSCRGASVRYEKGRLWLVHCGLNPTVPATGFRRRVHALMAIGWTQREIAAQLGIAPGNLALKLRANETVRRATHEAMSEIYERLCMTRREGVSARRTADIAARKGWAPPLAWDNIDDPAENPKPRRDHSVPDHVVVDRILAGHNMPATKADRLEVIRRWEADGRPLNELDRLTGWNSRRDRRAIA